MSQGHDWSGGGDSIIAPEIVIPKLAASDLIKERKFHIRRSADWRGDFPDFETARHRPRIGSIGGLSRSPVVGCKNRADNFSIREILDSGENCQSPAGDVR